MDELFNINLDNYDYHLEQNRIAKYPLPEREMSKLLLVDDSGNIEHNVFNNISKYLPENSLILLNKTKVIAARIFMLKETGGQVEILCVEPISPSKDPQIALSAKRQTTWNCIIGGKRIKSNQVFGDDIDKKQTGFSAKVLEKEGQNAIVEFSWKDDLTFSEILIEKGSIPLPPYLKRKSEKIDSERYQTLYADIKGSVAAPTAGLHFTEKVFETLKSKNINTEKLILHVGPGTFKPIDKSIAEHDMHNEMISVNIVALKNILEHLKKKSKIIATGTTSLRTIESIYWLAVKSYQNQKLDDFLEQWDWNSLQQDISPVKAIEYIIKLMTENDIEEFQARTKLFIIPGYKFKIVDVLITNFHLPKSTLILLVAAFIGKEKWKEVYKEAIDNDYRFLSYGDSSLLFRV